MGKTELTEISTKPKQLCSNRSKKHASTPPRLPAKCKKVTNQQQGQNNQRPSKEKISWLPTKCQEPKHPDRAKQAIHGKRPIKPPNDSSTHHRPFIDAIHFYLKKLTEKKGFHAFYHCMETFKTLIVDKMNSSKDKADDEESNFADIIIVYCFLPSSLPRYMFIASSWIPKYKIGPVTPYPLHSSLFPPCMADLELDQGFMFDLQGRVDVFRSPFFDINFEINHSIEDYIDRIFYPLTSAIGDHQPPVQWQIIQQPSTTTSLDNSSLSNTARLSAIPVKTPQGLRLEFFYKIKVYCVVIQNHVMPDKQRFSTEIILLHSSSMGTTKSVALRDISNASPINGIATEILLLRSFFCN
ncbi:hypothetical protein M5K25_013273 [Dendrobium thyrsiflorum]|uniref:Uncharacterized protein n=1 Tax=Dendrobium thyrsiflorum TaxID=117978 RepID=A0ABD0USJ4_DENTH